MDLLDLNRKQLREMCKEHGIKNYGRMTVDEMREQIKARMAEKQVEEQVIEPVEEPETKTPKMAFGVPMPTNTVGVMAGRKVEKRPQKEKKYTIEKNREQQNGLKRPSKGTICAELWDCYDKMGDPEIKYVKQFAEANGFDQTTATIQFYRWRKFRGIQSKRKGA